MGAASNYATIRMEAICVNAELVTRESLTASLAVKVNYSLQQYSVVVGHLVGTSNKIGVERPIASERTGVA